MLICAFQPPYRRTDSETGRYPSLFDNIDEQRPGRRDDEQVCTVLLTHVEVLLKVCKQFTRKHS